MYLPLSNVLLFIVWLAPLHKKQTLKNRTFWNLEYMFKQWILNQHWNHTELKWQMENISDTTLQRQHPSKY